MLSGTGAMVCVAGVPIADHLRRRRLGSNVHDVSGDDETPDDDAAEPDFTPRSDPIETARRRHGTAGAVLAAGLFGIDVALGRKPKEEIPVVVDAPTEPIDIDADGIRLEVDEATTVVAPALPRADPPRRARRSRHRRNP
jgi:hypothetical protein